MPPSPAISRSASRTAVRSVLPAFSIDSARMPTAFSTRESCGAAEDACLGVRLSGCVNAQGGVLGKPANHADHGILGRWLG